MIRRLGLYIHFTIARYRTEADILPPRGPILVVSGRNFQLLVLGASVVTIRLAASGASAAKLCIAYGGNTRCSG